MTNLEFNKKYKKYIQEGFEGCSLYNEKMLEYLDKEFEEFIKVDEFSFSQIKGKFNFFRFYAKGISQEKMFEIERNLKQIDEDGMSHVVL